VPGTPGRPSTGLQRAIHARNIRDEDEVISFVEYQPVEGVYEVVDLVEP
jgi:hypothetical protein